MNCVRAIMFSLLISFSLNYTRSVARHWLLFIFFVLMIMKLNMYVMYTIYIQ